VLLHAVASAVLGAMGEGDLGRHFPSSDPSLAGIASGELLAFDHKTVLSLLAFAIIGALLVLQFRSGLRGRRAARLVLAAYLLLTLAYPGVKLVTDVLIG
jgi:2C-methyl-D-erythritol 2,4-cyclodiphosphate synthase